MELPMSIGGVGYVPKRFWVLVVDVLSRDGMKNYKNELVWCNELKVENTSRGLMCIPITIGLPNSDVPSHLCGGFVGTRVTHDDFVTTELGWFLFADANRE